MRFIYILPLLLVTSVTYSADCTLIDLNMSTVTPDGGYAYRLIGDFGATPDDDNTTTSTLRLFEDGVEIGPAHSFHADIRNIGGGRFSHWYDGTDESIYFSATDNTNVAANCKIYSYCTTAPVGITNLLENSGFEDTPIAWTQSQNTIISNDVTMPPRTGSKAAWLNGYGKVATERLFQTVTIPNVQSNAILSFWIRIKTAETTKTKAYDTLSVQIKNSSDVVLTTLATYSNLDKNEAYAEKVFDLTGYKGQTIKLYFTGKEDGNLATSFIMDDFMLSVEGSGETPPPADTTPPTIPANLTATAINDNQINLSWTASTDNIGVIGYRIKRNGTAIATSATNSFSNTGLTASTQYSYTVEAFDNAGNYSATSNSASATTTAIPEPPPPVVAGAAFPGAQGSGATASGGRGGSVIYVDSLADSGAGTLRACLAASGARTCIFRVAGNINVTTPLYISNANVTIAGQSAPGLGITLTGINKPRTNGMSVLYIEADNVIVRYIRIRHGYNSNCYDPGGELNCGNNIMIAQGTEKVVIDHVTATWNSDEAMASWMNSSAVTKDITFSYNIIAEGLDSHSTGFMTGSQQRSWSDTMVNLDYHHNLTMNNNHRNPQLKHKSSRYVNNLHYNMRRYAMQLLGGVSADVINNIYKTGPMQRSSQYWTYHAIQAGPGGTEASNGSPSIYLSGNVDWDQSTPAVDQWSMAATVTGENGGETGPITASWKRTTPLPAPTFPIIPEATSTLENNLLPIVGASRRVDCNGAWTAMRDDQDLKLITQYTNDTGISSLSQNHTGYGGYPTIPSATPCTDTDLDGMPDAYETAKGLNPNSATDRNTVAPNGYTWLENYLEAL